MVQREREERATGTATDTAAVNGVERPLLIVMLPARNAEADLPGYLENVSTFCDMVVALDDGSTDGTHDILASHPLVSVLLRNPRREDYRGWDDAANRNRLLATAAKLNPAWLFSLDADERLDARDAASLREFLQTDALPGFAYGLRHVSMRGDTDHFLPRYWWYYRLFSAAPGQRFPNQKLHFVPVPTNIPRSRWIKTSLRIQHLGELDAERRLIRFGKYLEADPTRKYEDNYADFLVAPSADEIRRWLPRPACVPVLLGDTVHDDTANQVPGDEPAIPTVSAIIIDLEGDASSERTITSVLRQELPGTLETLVVARTGSRTERIAREAFPSVTLVSLPVPALPGEARNRGLAIARGRWVTFLGPDTELPPDSLAARLPAHRRGYAMVTGTTVNGTLTPAGWASYFLEHADTLPGHAQAEVDEPLSHCSYAQLPLNEVGGFPEGARTDEEIIANQSLIRRGYVAYREPGVRIIHHGPGTIGRLLQRQFRHGRGQGRMVLARHRDRGRLLTNHNTAALVLGALPQRLRRIEDNAAQAHDDIRTAYQPHRRLVAAGAAAAVTGMWWEILRPGRGKAAILWGNPVLNVLLGGRQGFALAQVDAISGEATVQPVPPGIKVSHGTRLVSMADLLAIEDGGPDKRALPAFRDVVAKALDVEPLDCILDPRLDLPPREERTIAVTPPASGWIGIVRQAGSLVRGIRERHHTVRSTLNPWTTARVLRRVGRYGRQPGHHGTSEGRPGDGPSFAG